MTSLPDFPPFTACLGAAARRTSAVNSSGRRSAIDIRCRTSLPAEEVEVGAALQGEGVWEKHLRCARA